MKQESNMYPGVKTWNPLGGECPHKCGYCSTNALKRYPAIALKYSGPLNLYFDVLKKVPISGNVIFVVGQNDLFADKIPGLWISHILDKCKSQEENTYLFQSKNPRRFIEFSNQFPPKTILCTTIETNRSYPQMGKAPGTKQRAYDFSQITGFTKQITVEPIMSFDLEEMAALIKMANPDIVNLGADSKGNHLPEPSKDKILALIDELKKFTIIVQKRNLQRLLK